MQCALSFCCFEGFSGIQWEVYLIASNKGKLTKNAIQSWWTGNIKRIAALLPLDRNECYVWENVLVWCDCIWKAIKCISCVMYSVGLSLCVKSILTLSLVITSRTLTCHTCWLVPSIFMSMIFATSAELRTSSRLSETQRCSRSSLANERTSRLISMAEYSLICCW